MPSTDVVRRRRLGALAVAAAALVAGAAVGAGVGDGQDDRQPTTAAGGSAEPGLPQAAEAAEPRDVQAARRLPLTRQVGQLVVLRFAGTDAPAYVRSALRRRRAAGVILFADNVTTPEALRDMTSRLQRAGRGRALISVDQEGGTVRRIPFAGPEPAQGTLGTAEEAAATARAGARDLASLGINVNLAPVADVASVPGSVVAGRAFPGATAAVSRIVRASVAAYRGTGVVPTLKHFPGIGGTAVNTDDDAATITRSARGIGAIDLPPFRAGIEAGAPLVMTSHARYPALDRSRIASQSPVVHRLLRETLGFEGLVVTDSLEAAAVRAEGGVEIGAIRSVRAGADLLLTTGPGSYLDVLRAVVAEAERDASFRERVIQSAARVLALKRRVAAAAPG